MASALLTDKLLQSRDLSRSSAGISASGISRLQIEVVVGVAPTERTNGNSKQRVPGCEWKNFEIAGRASNSWLRKSRADAREVEEYMAARRGSRGLGSGTYH